MKLIFISLFIGIPRYKRDTITIITSKAAENTTRMNVKKKMVSLIFQHGDKDLVCNTISDILALIYSLAIKASKNVREIYVSLI